MYIHFTTFLPYKFKPTGGRMSLLVRRLANEGLAPGLVVTGEVDCSTFIGVLFLSSLGVIDFLGDTDSVVFL